MVEGRKTYDEQAIGLIYKLGNLRQELERQGRSADAARAYKEMDDLALASIRFGKLRQGTHDFRGARHLLAYVVAGKTGTVEQRDYISMVSGGRAIEPDIEYANLVFDDALKKTSGPLRVRDPMKLNMSKISDEARSKKSKAATQQYEKRQQAVFDLANYESKLTELHARYKELADESADASRRKDRERLDRAGAEMLEAMKTRSEYERKIYELKEESRVKLDFQDALRLSLLPMLKSDDRTYRELALNLVRDMRGKDPAKLTSKELERIRDAYKLEVMAYSSASNQLRYGVRNAEKEVESLEATLEARKAEFETGLNIKKPVPVKKEETKPSLGANAPITILLSFGVIGGLLGLFSFLSNSATAYTVLPGVSSSTGFFIIPMLLLSGGFLFYLFRKR